MTQCVQTAELTLRYLLILDLSMDHLCGSASGFSSDFSGHGNRVIDIVILKRVQYSFFALALWLPTIQFSSLPYLNVYNFTLCFRRWQPAGP